MYLTKLYCDECVVHDCITNSAILAWLKCLDETNEQPTAVDLSDNYLGDRNFAAFCTVLSTLPSVEVLNVSNVDLQVDGVRALCQLATKHRGLRCIDLRRNQLFASSGRALAELLKVNPRIRQLMFDSEHMPERFATQIRTQLGKNVANAFPCTWDSVARADADIEPIDAVPDRENDTGFDSLTAFQQQVVQEAEAAMPELLSAYASSGMFALQFLVDFGPEALPTLAELVPAFDRPSRSFALVTAPRHTLLQPIMEAELTAVRENTAVKGAVEGTLLDAQIDQAVERSRTIASDETCNHLYAMLQHIRRSLASLRELDKHLPNCPEWRAVRAATLAEWDTTRRLQLLHFEARYMVMDFPAMAEEVSRVNATCQAPLRVSDATVLQHVVRRARPVYAAKRRELLQTARAVTHPALFRAIMRHWIAAALDYSSGIDDLHHGTMAELQPQALEWVSLLASCATASDVGILVERAAAANRIASLAEPSVARGVA
jgi:hypothetical protein